jgi:hypothetical protein
MGHPLYDRPFDRISNAFLKGGNSSRSIRSARRRIPAAAFWLKKYFCGTSPFSIRSHNEDSLTRLGDSEVFAVKHTPSHAIPEFGQSPYDEDEISSVVGREKARHVFEENNSGAVLLNQSRKLVKESRLLPSKPRSRPHSSQRDVLAGESSGPDIGKRDGSWIGDIFDVFRRLDFRPVAFEDRPAVRVDLALVGNPEACSLESKVEPSDAGEERGDGWPAVTRWCYEVA